MKNIKILHLYASTLDLYGDTKNLTALAQRITETGNTVEITTAELFEELDLDGYDMVYIGHGKIRNLAAAAAHFVPYGETVKQHIENGQLWLAVGNSRELFGKSFTDAEGNHIQGIGLFDYIGVETGKVFVSDMVGVPAYNEEERVYGFANRTAFLKGDNRYPLFTVTHGFGDGESPDGKEGTLYHNFFATWSLGPVLARNPSLMKELLRRLLGEEYGECDFSLEQKALELVLQEF